MEPKGEMPQQILGRAFGATQENKSAQCIPDTSSARVSQGPTFPQLEFVKRTQVLAQE